MTDESIYEQLKTAELWWKSLSPKFKVELWYKTVKELKQKNLSMGGFGVFIPDEFKEELEK